jgi:hyperosmotically inducible protein
VLLAATVSFASAQEGAKQQARETTQDVKDAAKKSGNAISDSWITLKIHSQFIPEDALSDSDIDVDTKSGVVTLNGTVASEAGRTKAIAIAKATDGVNRQPQGCPGRRHERVGQGRRNEGGREDP